MVCPWFVYGLRLCLYKKYIKNDCQQLNRRLILRLRLPLAAKNRVLLEDGGTIMVLGRDLAPDWLGSWVPAFSYDSRAHEILSEALPIFTAVCQQLPADVFIEVMSSSKP